MAAKTAAIEYKPVVETSGKVRKRCMLDPFKTAEWALSKACNAMRAGDGCEHSGCAEALDAYEVLGRLQRFEGMDNNGQLVKGYIIED